MKKHLTRRTFIKTTSGLCIAPMIVGGLAETSSVEVDDKQQSIYDEFPAQDPEQVREMVGVSHGNVTRVRELLALHPSLAKATWDWGFGDWETALGAASHVGNNEIARLLIANGARPDIFTFAMFGNLDVVKAYIMANPGIQKIHGPHGLTLMHHARVGGEQSKPVVEYLQQVGDADIVQASSPLSEEEKLMYTGDYSFGTDANLKMRINVNKDGTLSITRLPVGTNRRIFYLGNHEFYPTGAPAVRVRFEVQLGKSKSLSIIDGTPTLTAQRDV